MMDDTEMNDLFEKLRNDVLNNKEETISKTQLKDNEILDKGNKSPAEESTEENGNTDQVGQNESSSIVNEIATDKSEIIEAKEDNSEELAPDIYNEPTSPTLSASPASLTNPLSVIQKQVKINVKRDDLTDLKKVHSNDKRNDQSFKKPKTPVKRKNTDVSSPIASKEKKTKNESVLSVSNVTPTKAQQKLFDPKLLGENEILRQYNCKRLKIKLKKTDLHVLLNKTSINNKNNKPTSPPNRRSNTPTPESSPGKKTRKSSNEKDAKSNFFIKLSPKLESNKDASSTAKKGSLGKSPAPVKSPKNQKPKSLVKKIGSNERAQKENFKLTVKPTKFSKTFLEKTYGKRFFQLKVKMEKFEHPILVEFEAKANAAKKEARDKKKNLSVSFKDQVEIFGISDSDSDVEHITTSAIKEPANKAPQIPVTPAKLIKTENGKVIDTIDLDSTLFLDPKDAVASTPLKLPARKKHDKKSFSPLKDEGLTSPRKEQLKLADEKLPPKDLRCLSTGEVEEDDEDVEYIVPFEVPPRTSAKSGTDTESDDVAKEADSDKQIPNNNENKENENKQNEKIVGEDETSAKKSPEVSVSSETDSKLESSAESFETAGNTSDNDDASFAKLNNVEGSLSKTCDTAESNENKTNMVEEKKKIADGNEEIKDSNIVKFDKCSDDGEVILRMEDDVSEKHQDTEAYSEDDNKDSEKVSNDDSTETHPPEPDSAADPETDDEELKNSQSKADKQTVSTTTTELVGVTNSNI